MPAPNSTIGALNIGSQISFLLLGTLITQGYSYYINYPMDSKWVKWFVGVILTIEIAHGVAVAVADYIISVTNYGEPESQLLARRTPLMLDLWILYNAFIASMVQAFVTRRILIISRSWYIPLFCWMLAFLRFIGNMILFYGGVTEKSLEAYSNQWRWCLITVLVISTVTDVAISSTLCILFYNERQTALPRTARLLSKLIAWTIPTGIMTSISGILVLISFLRWPHSLIWIGIYEVLPRMYSNTLLASLNARSFFVNTINTGIPVSMQSITPIRKESFQTGQINGKKLTPIMIEMSRITDVEPGDTETQPVVGPSKVDLEGHTTGI